MGESGSSWKGELKLHNVFLPAAGGRLALKKQIFLSLYYSLKFIPKYVKPKHTPKGKFSFLLKRFGLGFPKRVFSQYNLNRNSYLTDIPCSVSLHKSIHQMNELCLTCRLSQNKPSTINKSIWNNAFVPVSDYNRAVRIFICS